MRQALKLAALGEMIAGLAHEINNPLTVISGNAQFLTSHFKDRPITQISSQDWKEIVASFCAIDRESERCAKLVADLLQLSHHSRDVTPRQENVLEGKAP